MTQQQLAAGLAARLMETMDIPAMRRDISKRANLEWLADNAALLNPSHESIEPLMLALMRALEQERAAPESKQVAPKSKED